MATALARPIIPAIVQQHVEDAASLRHIRSVLLRAPHVRLLQLGRLDDRIEAHLDGLRVAGDPGRALARAALERLDVGSAFVVLVDAIEQRDATQALKLLSLREVAPEVARAAASAVGWVSRAELKGWVKDGLGADDPAQVWLSLVACAVHRADPGRALSPLLTHGDARLRLRAVQAAGELGRVDLREACSETWRAAWKAAQPEATEAVTVLVSPSVDAQVSADAAQGAAVHTFLQVAAAALRLGERGALIEVLQRMALDPASPGQAPALALLMLHADADRRRHIVSALARLATASPRQRRLLIQASGWSGDPKVLPWLMQQMADLKVARLAGEAFSAITGADLARLDLENIHQPDAPPAGPTDDPDDEDVAMDEDDSLPWPNVDKIRAWWSREGGRYTPGVRHLLGEPVSPTSLVRVLEEGSQRVRAQAAELRCALTPGTPLFNIASPHWRQLRELKALSAA